MLRDLKPVLGRQDRVLGRRVKEKLKSQGHINAKPSYPNDQFPRAWVLTAARVVC